MKKTIFRKLLIAMGLTLLLCLLIYPLLLPTENYFKLVAQLIPMSIIVGALMIAPLYIISDKMSRSISQQLKRMRLDSKSTLNQYPELKPLARQVAGLKAQIDTQMNELTGQQEQLRVLTDNMQEGLLLVSSAGRVLSHNHAALQLLGKADTTDDLFSVYDLSESESFTQLVSQALEGIRGTMTMTVDDKAVQLIANPVFRDNTPTGAVLVLLDVSEREKRDALRREFTSNVSHELKTPLTSIYGIADMMESGMVKKKDISGFARRIRDESSRMIALIEDIIRLSRLDDDSFTEEVLPIDLYEIAQNVRGQLQSAADARHITMTLEGDAAPMKGVPVIVEEMLYNLCDNAIKYNVENGSVHMKVACTEQRTVFTVSDTGIGIPLADKERIFERFYRVDKSHSKQIGGTGLGLSIVKHGAQFHNASIELDSQLGSGTTIKLFFPRSAEAAALAESEARLDPLNVDIPDEKEAATVQIREELPAVPESDEACAEEVRAAEELLPDEADHTADAPTEDTENSADETEPESAEETMPLHDESDDADEAEVESNESIEPEEPLDPEEIERASRKLNLDETEQLLREAFAALDLDPDEPDEPEEENEEYDEFDESDETYDEDDEPDEDDDESESQEEPEPEQKPRRIDVKPLDEDNMDIHI